MIKAKIKEQMILAMKSKDSLKLTTIRMILAKIKDKEIDLRTSESSVKELDDTALLVLMQQMIKQRNDSIAEYTKANRLDLSTKEQEEILIIKTFMPKPLSEEEIEKIIVSAISSTQAKSVKDMGKLVGYIKDKYPGQVDVGIISQKIKNLLDK